MVLSWNQTGQYWYYANADPPIPGVNVAVLTCTGTGTGSLELILDFYDGYECVAIIPMTGTWDPIALAGTGTGSGVCPVYGSISATVTGI